MKIPAIIITAALAASCTQGIPVVIGVKTDGGELDYSSKGGLQVTSDDVTITDEGIKIVIDERSAK